jgi:tellurium resistance protein TerZ
MNMVSLSKTRRYHSANNHPQSASLFGLGWDPVKKKGLFGSIFGGNDSIDLDAGCVLLDVPVIKLTPSGFVN